MVVRTGLDYSTEDLTRDPAVTDEQLKGLAGFDVDVADPLARLVRAKVRIVPTSWFGSEAGLLEKRSISV